MFLRKRQQKVWLRGRVPATLCVFKTRREPRLVIYRVLLSHVPVPSSRHFITRHNAETWFRGSIFDVQSIDPSVNLDKERSFVGSGRITPSGMNTTSIGQSRCLAARISCTELSLHRISVVKSHVRDCLFFALLSPTRQPRKRRPDLHNKQCSFSEKLRVINATSFRNLSRCFEHGESSVKVIISKSA